MSASGRRGWTAAQILLAFGLLATVLLTGTEAGRLVTPLRVIGAVVGAAMIVTYLLRSPREHDLVDVLVLAGLLLFLLTCVTSSVPRLSFEAATTALAYAGAFWVARGAVADPRGRDLAIVVLGALGALLGVLFVVTWGGVWIEWIGIAGGVPPLDLNLPSAPYAGIHVAILCGFLLPAAVLLTRRRGLWPVGVVGATTLLAAILMSGSRSVWLGLLVAGVALLVLGAHRVVLRAPRALLAIGLVGVAALTVLVAPQLVARLATGSTVELRLAIWGESFERWTGSPLTGYGPGTFAAQFNLTDYYNRFEPWHTHPHNTIVQILVESGVVGVGAALLLVAALVIGMRGHRPVGWAPVAAVAFAAGVGLTENPTISAYLVAPLIVWAALTAPRVTSESRTKPSLAFRSAHLGLAAVAGVAVLSTFVAAGLHDHAASAARRGDPAEVTRALERAAMFDPALPLYRRELGVWLLSAGELEEAEAEIGRALELNPADTVTLRAWALLRMTLGDQAGALAAAREAHRRADLHPENALTLAYVAAQTGDAETERAALLRAVRRYPWLLAAPEWEAVFPDTPRQALLAEAHASWTNGAEFSHRNLPARRWLAAATGQTLPDAEAGTIALSALLRCREDEAAAALGSLTAAQASNADTLRIRLMVARAFGDVDDDRLLPLLAAHDPGNLRMATVGVTGASAAGDHNADVAVYGRVPIRPPIGPFLPTETSGLSAWLRDPVAAADLGARESALAGCR